MPASSGAQAQVLMALLKDVADGKSSAEETLKMAAKSSNEPTAVSTPTTETRLGGNWPKRKPKQR